MQVVPSIVGFDSCGAADFLAKCRAISPMLDSVLWMHGNVGKPRGAPALTNGIRERGRPANAKGSFTTGSMRGSLNCCVTSWVVASSCNTFSLLRINYGTLRLPTSRPPFLLRFMSHYLPLDNAQLSRSCLLIFVYSLTVQGHCPLY